MLFAIPALYCSGVGVVSLLSWEKPILTIFKLIIRIKKAFFIIIVYVGINIDCA